MMIPDSGLLFWVTLYMAGEMRWHSTPSRPRCGHSSWWYIWLFLCYSLLKKQKVWCLHTWMWEPANDWCRLLWVCCVRRSKPALDLDVGVIRRALFKTMSDVSQHTPVNFTVQV